MNRPHVLVAAPLMPEFDREGGSKRIFDLIRLLRDGGHPVTFVAQNGHNFHRYGTVLQQMGVATFAGFDQRLERIVATGGIDVALLAFWYIAEQLTPLVRRLAPRARVVVDTIDLHFVRHARQAFLEGVGRTLEPSFADEARRELNAYAAADAVLTVSQKEADLIDDLLTRPVSHAVPDCEELAPSPFPLEQRRGLLFVGNFRHLPNVGAVEYLCRRVLPLVDPGLLERHPVSIVGNAPTDAVRDAVAAAAPHARLVGWVPSVVPYIYRARASVVPLLYGAGTKRKLMQSLIAGTPAVSTPVGVEGLGLAPDREVLVASDPVWFARHVERLLSDDVLWKGLAEDGRARVQAAHSPAAVSRRLAEVIATICQGAAPAAPPPAVAV